jgi:hypothetical protein
MHADRSVNGNRLQAREFDMRVIYRWRLRGLERWSCNNREGVRTAIAEKKMRKYKQRTEKAPCRRVFSKLLRLERASSFDWL